MNIRPASSGDLPEIARLTRELAGYQADWRVFPPREGFEARVLETYRRAVDAGSGLLLVGEEGSRVVGMAFGEVVVPSRFSDEPAVELSGVVVEAPARSRGVGRALVREVARWASERGVRRIVLMTFAPNTEALTFWERLGFEPRVVQFTAPPDAVLRASEGL